jgi:hypothetical protein
MKLATKHYLSLFLALLIMLSLTACGDSASHAGEAKAPSGSSTQKGKNYQEVINEFEKQGFINIKTEVLDDLITGWLTDDGEVESVSVDGDEDYLAGRWYPNDAAVLVKYHTFPINEDDASSETSTDSSTNLSETDDPDNPATQESGPADTPAEIENFPAENAKRAAVVALTNSFAADVFQEDGNTYDVSKFHSYDDTSGNFFKYYFKVNSWGTWSVADEQTWHVDSLELENLYGTIAKASLDVNFDDNQYIISNLTGTFAQDSDLSETDDLFLSVPSELIKEDRGDSKLDTYDDWVNDQFSAWDGSHKDLKELIVDSLNDEKSYEHIETSYQIVIVEEMMDEINKTLEDNKLKARVEIGDLWISTQFSAKNSFNAVVKNTAYGIASFLDNSITLVAIE